MNKRQYQLLRDLRILEQEGFINGGNTLFVGTGTYDEGTVETEPIVTYEGRECLRLMKEGDFPDE